MMTDHSTKSRWGQYAALMIYLANILLFFSLISVRSARIAGSNTSFFSALFIGLGLFTLILIVVTTRFASDRLRRLVQSHSLWFSLAWMILSVVGLFLISSFIESLQTYTPPFALWLIIFDLAIAVLLIEPFAARVDFNHMLRKAGIVLLSIAIPFLLLELGLRFWFGTFGSEQDKVLYLYSSEQIINEASRFAGSPYINYGLSPNHPDHNSRGYRGKELQTPKPENTYRIFALGGSTTYGIGIAAQAAYPAQLQRVLHENYGYTHVEVVNAGVMAYSTYDTLANFTYHVLDDEPDMILVYHAVNDVITRLVEPPSYNGLNPIRGIWSPRSRDLGSSTLLRFVGINTGFIDNPATLEWALPNLTTAIKCPSEQEICEALNLSALDVLEANPPIYFERNLRNLIALAEANDVDVLLSSWAYFPEAVNGSQEMTLEHMQTGVAQHNAITQSLAEEHQIPFYDFNTNMPSNADYWLDGLHMTASGAREQAEEYAAFLVENGLLPAP